MEQLLFFPHFHVNRGVVPVGARCVVRCEKQKKGHRLSHTAVTKISPATDSSFRPLLTAAASKYRCEGDPPEGTTSVRVTSVFLFRLSPFRSATFVVVCCAFIGTTPAPRTFPASLYRRFRPCVEKLRRAPLQLKSPWRPGPGPQWRVPTRSPFVPGLSVGRKRVPRVQEVLRQNLGDRVRPGQRSSRWLRRKLWKADRSVAVAVYRFRCCASLFPGSWLASSLMWNQSWPDEGLRPAASRLKAHVVRSSLCYRLLLTAAASQNFANEDEHGQRL